MRRVVRSSFLFLLLAAAAAARADGFKETTAQIMARQAVAPAPPVRIHELELQYPDRSTLGNAPGAAAVSQWPAAAPTTAPATPTLPQPVALQFDGATLADTGAFPPDTMGAVGPSQFFVFVNGRLRTFTKATGVADGVINANPDVFFSSVMTPPVANNFTSDPRVRYDRLTGKWILIIIDVPGQTGALPNRVLLAVSDGPTITGSTVWTFFYFQPETTNFCDYPTLGVDVNALYIGGNIFTPAGAFAGTSGYVVRKSLLSGAGGAIAFTRFPFVTSAAGAGPYTPQGVDNDDPAATEGYFIGVDNAAFGQLDVRRVSNPGSPSPTVSADITLPVPTTYYPNTVPHLGNTGGTNGNLDALDDRLFAAQLKKGHLWTAHNILVNTSGVGTASGTRNGSRWYDITSLTTTPTLVQSGTLFDSAAGSPKFYWIPSIAVSGQGHAALGASSAGTSARINAVTAGRFASDTLGTLQTLTTYTSSATAYNPASDPGGSSGRRWGDYSFTSLDPLDDMTLWTIQEYCQATNSYAVRAAKLQAPVPATPSNGPQSLQPSLASQTVNVVATSSSGSGFYDPGTNLAPPALPFNHLAASVSPAANITVNSVTYVDPTHLTLSITTSGAAAGARDLTITNPDGQTVTAVGYLVIASPAELTRFDAD